MTSQYPGPEVRAWKKGQVLMEIKTHRLAVKGVDGRGEIRPWVSAGIVFVLLNSLGFPGSYTGVFGDMFGKAVEYSSFFIQVFFLLRRVREGSRGLGIIELRKEHAAVYAFLAVVFAVSLAGTSNIREELVSCIRFSVTALFALWMAEHLDVRSFLSHFCCAQVLVLIASVCFALFFSSSDPAVSDPFLPFCGIFGIKNVAARELCLAAVLTALLMRVKKEENDRVGWCLPVLFALQFLLLIMSRGLGALIVCIFTVAVVFAFRGKLRWNLGAAWLVLSVGFLIFALTALPLLEPVLNALGKNATITGRVPLWRRLLEFMQTSHTLTGYGFGHFWRDGQALELLHAGYPEKSFLGNVTSGAHNCLLELWLNTGLIGVAAFALLLTAAFRRARDIRFVPYLFCVAFMSFFTILGFTERLWSVYEYVVLFLFYALGLADLERERALPDQEPETGSNAEDAPADSVTGSGE